MAGSTGFYIAVLYYQLKSFYIPSPGARLTHPASSFVEPDVYVRADEGPTTSIYTNDSGKILVSLYHLSQLSDTELRAVLAHEEAHIKKHRDTLLAQYAPLLAISILTTQATILFSLGFWNRELRADRYAVQRLQNEGYDPSALIDVVKKSTDYDFEQSGIELGTPPFSSTPDRLRTARLDNIDDSMEAIRDQIKRSVSKLQVIITGRYAIAKAHPSPVVRIAHIQEAISNAENN